ncbi:DUF2871 domain-containing protein [Niameybacter massiliensis]|uniref:DUF2871 domain-containing protein n=1 Tax=Holtiella tumoricola TaxID=3018743 RepID=A0AA42DQI9_9FIRM|nr:MULTISPECIES: DUF2871 domain-containing protein [Lachnospirales]MDA3733345.1 DUF2871 domain-containing protein [Holtiella tumoricola]
MKKYYNTAFIYLVLGLGLGVFYREFTKMLGFEGQTVLRGLHTHVIVLGFIFFMIVLLLEKNFNINGLKQSKVWFIFYNISFVAVIVTMLVRGILEVKGLDMAGLSHMAGLAHALMGGALIWFMILLGKAIKDN